MSMNPSGAQANGLAAARAEARGDQEYASKLFRAVVREATRLQRRGNKQAADALVAAFQRGHGGRR
jgi:hypothetical protein